jgi:hypothetical protein
MLTFDIDTKESVFKAISLFSKRKTNSKVLEITTNDNRNITVTDKHPMFVLQEGKLKIKFAGDLHVGDKMPFAILPEDGDKRNANSYESKGITISNIKNIEKVKGGFVYSAEVEDTHTIVTSYGAIVHNCIPKDPLYLSWKARKVGFKTRMIDLASHINIFMPHHVVHRAEVMFKKKDIDIAKAKILVLGVTYKKDVKDLRESPALEIIELLQNKKAKTCYSDPYIPYLDIDGIHLKGVKVTAGSIKAYDLLILATDHSGFNYKMLAKSAKLILDTRNAFGRRGIRGKNIVKL